MKQTITLPIVRHDHVRSDGSVLTHAHTRPHLHHAEKESRALLPPSNFTYDDGVDLDVFAKVEGSFEVDPYGATMACIGIALRKGLERNGQMSEGEYMILQRVLATIRNDDPGWVEDL